MNDSSAPNDAWCELLERLLDNDLSDRQFDELKSLLHTNQEAREDFNRQLNMHVLLEMHFADERAAAPAPVPQPLSTPIITLDSAPNQNTLNQLHPSG